MASLKQLKRFFRKHGRGNDTRSPEGQRRAAITAGDAARNRHAWPEAVAHYSLALAQKPNDAALLVQYGHALKESGRIAEAEGAYRAASIADSADTEGLMQLGHVYRGQQRTAEALDIYAEALRRNPQCNAARNELIAAGARDRLTMFNYGQSAITSTLAHIGNTLDQNLQAIQELLVVSTFPVEAYDAFRKTFPIQPPPLDLEATHTPLAVRIDGYEKSPALLRRTLDSLVDQRYRNWQAHVFTSVDTRKQAVASIEDRDPRISFITNFDAGHELLGKQETIVNIGSGTVLDPEALGWIRFAALRSPNSVAYSDHDHYTAHWRTGLTRLAPAFQPAPDCYDLATTPAPPALISMPSAIFRGLLQKQGITFSTREALQFAYIQGASVTHIPRILAGIPAVDRGQTQPKASSSPTSPQPADNATILVIVPTRDQAKLLRACIFSLKNMAKRPELLRIAIVDNNSTDPETLTYLNEAQTYADTTLVRSPSPFNWSYLNNNAASSIKGSDILVFANNDVEILTSGWDDLVRLALLKPDVGVLGARLLYPDGSLQHAGIALGYDDNRPHHEGAGAPGNIGGPLERWRRRRAAGAVTGAFMAVRREVFEEAGGFNENLAIGYNDIDFCFRVRQLGKKAVFEPGIEAIHHESKTRGFNNSEEKVEWDDTELEHLYAIWGESLFKDPSINPQWVNTRNHAFNGFRDLSLRQVTAWMDYSANTIPRERESS